MSHLHCNATVSLQTAWPWSDGDVPSLRGAVSQSSGPRECRCKWNDDALRLSTLIKIWSQNFEFEFRIGFWLPHLNLSDTWDLILCQNPDYDSSFSILQLCMCSNLNLSLYLASQLVFKFGFSSSQLNRSDLLPRVTWTAELIMNHILQMDLSSGQISCWFSGVKSESEFHTWI